MKEKTGKTWQEKLRDSKGLPRVEVITPRMSRRWGTGTILIPAPREVDELMKGVPKGKLTTINRIRAKLARRHCASICCPITTGIFASIAAQAAEEAASQGRKRTTPFWRTLKEGGVINEKYPRGLEGQKRLLENEGHKIVNKGKRYLVVDYERSLIK